MNPILANMAARRSIRSFLPDAPPPYQLREILEAGRMAPSGGNKQACHFLVIQSPDILAELSQRAVAAFAQMEATPDTYQSLASSIRKAEQGAYDFLYGAPVLVLAANLIDHGNAMADSACALENMMLGAAGFGLGSCWINQIRWGCAMSLLSVHTCFPWAWLRRKPSTAGWRLVFLNKGRLCLWPVQAIVLPIYKKKPPKGGLFSSSYAGIVLCSCLLSAGMGLGAVS